MGRRKRRREAERISERIARTYDDILAPGQKRVANEGYATRFDDLRNAFVEAANRYNEAHKQAHQQKRQQQRYGSTAGRVVADPGAKTPFPDPNAYFSRIIADGRLSSEEKRDIRKLFGVEADAIYEKLQAAFDQRETTVRDLFKDGSREELLAEGLLVEEPTGPDPELVAAQQRVLDAYFDTYNKGGYTDAERAQFAEARRDAAADEARQRAAITQNAAARGLAGSGLELAAALGAQQGSANRVASAQNQQVIAGQQRALQALGAAGEQAALMRNQAYQDARALDQVRQFNATRLLGLRQAAFANEMSRLGAQQAARRGRIEDLRNFNQDQMNLGMSIFNAISGAAQQAVTGIPNLIGGGKKGGEGG